MNVRIVRNKKQVLGEYEVQYQKNDVFGIWENLGKFYGGMLLFYKTYEEALSALERFEEKVKDDCPHVVYEKKIENIKE